MGKDVEIVEGGPTMDPNSPQFQAMLETAKVGAAEKLSIKDDTTMVEAPADTTLVKPEEKLEKLDEVPGDDIGNLKEQVSGLQAELSRVRKLKAGSSEEASSLKERIADMEGQIKVLREKPSGATPTLLEKMAQLSDAEVISNRISWTDELTDARFDARTAAKDQDIQGVAAAQQRIANASKMLELYDTEKDRRTSAKVNQQKVDEDDRAGVATDLDALFSSVYKEVPDMLVKDSPIWKAGQAEYQKLPSLMKKLGPMGELIAVASAITKNPGLISKKVTSQVLDNIEKAADKAFQKGGAAPSGGNFKPVTAINSQADLLSFEEQVRKIKGG